MKNLWKMVGIVFAVSLVFGLASCSDDDDDPNEMISGSNGHYKISYTNGGSEISRGYNGSAQKHTGGIMKVVMNKDAGAGTMGFIFDLKANATNKDNKDFFIIGVNYKYSTQKGLAYYISKFENISDLQASNFGAPTNGTAGNGENGTTLGAKETVIKAAFQSISAKDEDIIDGDNVQFLIQVAGDYGDKPAMAGIPAGGYSVAIYKVGDLESDGKTIHTASTPLVEKVDIDSTKTGYTGDNAKVKQQPYGVYANVYPGKTLNASWDFLDTYNCVDVIDE